MAANNEAPNNESGPLDDDVLQRLAEIDASLASGLDTDDRIQSGVPASQRATDIDFIQMSGLTRAFSEDAAPLADDGAEDLSEPIDFFEKGVADVDASMAPPSLDDEASTLLAPQPPRPQAPPVPPVSEPENVPTPVAQTEEPQPEPVEETPPAADLLEEAAVLQVIEQLNAELKTQSVPQIDLPDTLAEEATAAPVSENVPEPEMAPQEPEAVAPEIAEPPVPEPAPLPERRPAAPELAEAEQLLQALEEQIPDKRPAAQPAPAFAPLPSSPLLDDIELDELPDKVETTAPSRQRLSIDYAAEPTPKPLRRHSRKSRDHTRRRLIRWATRVAAALILVVILVCLYTVAAKRLATPEDRMRGAQTLLAANQPLKASYAFESFADSYPNHKLKAEAQFLAANTMQQIKAQSGEEEQEYLTRALTLYDQFIKDNPGSVKVARARTLMGHINFKLHNYKEAINILRDPMLSLQDPDAALPALRTLARAYTQMGEYSAAESAYLQAASLTGNFSPDVDYVELGDLFQLRANRADTDEERIRFSKAAIEQWTYATRVPTIDPANKEKVQQKCQGLQKQMNSPNLEVKETSAEPSGSDLTGQTASSDGAAEAKPAAVAEIPREPVQEDAADAEPSAQEEAEYLGVPVDHTEPQTGS